MSEEPYELRQGERPPEQLYQGAWVPCPGCLEWRCRLHGGHASDCSCPPIEAWDGDPYGGGCCRAPWESLLDAARLVLGAEADDLGEALGWLDAAVAVLDGDGPDS